MFRALLPTIVSASIVALLFSQRHAGIGLLLLAFILLPWLLYSVYVIIRWSQRRAFQISKIAIWVVSVATILGVHYYLQVSTRANADALVAKIHDYQKNHGVCPANLEAIGLSKEKMREQLGLSVYGCEAGKLRLFYASTFVPFEEYRYDFERKQWKYEYD